MDLEVTLKYNIKKYLMDIMISLRYHEAKWILCDSFPRRSSHWILLDSIRLHEMKVKALLVQVIPTRITALPQLRVLKR